MGIGSGIGAQLGISAESAYGTYVAPGKFFEFTKEGLQLKKTTAQSSGIAASRRVALSSRRVLTQVSAAGPIDMEVTNKGMGLWLAHLLGSSAAPVQQASTAAYKQTHTIGDPAGKSLTIQKGVPLATGVVTDKTYVGCKIVGAEFSCGEGEMLTASFDIDAKDCDETRSLAAASYSNMSPFHFMQMSVKTGSYGTETALDGVRKMSLKIEIPSAVDRYYAGGNGRKAEPIPNDMVKISGNIEMDYLATTIDDLHTSDGGTSLLWEFVGPEIAPTYNERITFKVPVIKFDDAPPTVEGPGLIQPKFSFAGLYDGTNLTAIEYTSADITL